MLRKTIALSRAIVAHSLKLDKIDRVYRESLAFEEDLPFHGKVLKILNVSYEIDDADRARIPASGPVVVVANHPFGGVEGIVMLDLLKTVRPDVKIIANYLLGKIPEMQENFIFVDPFRSRGAARSNIRPLKESLSWLRNGGLLGSFPSGEVSSIDLRSARVRDPAWHPSIAAIVRSSGATVVPIFFAGHNGPLFQLAGLVHPRFRTLMLPSQVVGKRNRLVRIRVGAPITGAEMRPYQDNESLVKFLRLRTYVMAGRDERARKRISGLPLRRPPGKRQLIAGAAGTDDCAAEIASLSPDHKLLSGGDMDVFIAPSRDIPVIMREIGRLREITFRGVGEGTGKELDLDLFDDYYLHLFIWNRVAREIVGAYRLGLADVICDRFGYKGLYTRSLFRFDERLISCLQPAIELGRSFVRPEYQKAYSSLLLLWKGIATFLARNPRYRYLFGPVSITNEYRDASRNLMLRSLRLSNFAPELARFVKPRKRPGRYRRAEWASDDFNPYLNDLENVSAMIQDIEQDRKGIPILLRQYLKLGGRILAFNVDPGFSSVVDALIAMDLHSTDPRILARYMGRENAASYLGHQVDAGRGNGKDSTANGGNMPS